jgi:glycosyltransferase involved in cell wall biosynthesis
MKKPLLTISIPTYNRDNYLDKILNELEGEINQLPVDLQDQINICVVDNASTDATQEILNRHKILFQPLQFERNPVNLGIEGNLIRASLCATGEYTWMLSDHQTITPGTLKKLVNILLEQTPTVVIMDIVQWPTKHSSINIAARAFSSLHPDEIGEIAFLTGNVSTNAYQTRLALQTARLAHRISFSSYPNLAKLNALRPEDTVSRIPDATAFPDNSKNSHLVRYYDTFSASFIDHLAIIRKILPRSNGIRWSVKGFQEGAYSRAMAYELAKIVALGQSRAAPKLLHAIAVNFQGLLPTRCALMAAAALILQALPISIRKSLVKLTLNKIAPQSKLLESLRLLSK